MTQYLTVETPAPHIMLVRLNRPDAANALNTAMALELQQFFNGLPADGRAVILSGTGKHFCAGADLKERKGMEEAAWKTQHAAFRTSRDAILACPIPVIAAVHGAAMGGGLELALACDFIYAADDARFALTEATLGIMPGMGGTQLLPRSIDIRRARELLYTGQTFSAAEAQSWGMVNHVCPAAALHAEAIACAERIAANAPLSVRAIKQSINRGAEESLTQGLALELSHYDRLLPTRDRQEGINAFNDKRKPNFTAS